MKAPLLQNLLRQKRASFAIGSRKCVTRQFLPVARNIPIGQYFGTNYLPCGACNKLESGHRTA